LHKLRE